jgi:hypothetical protein
MRRHMCVHLATTKYFSNSFVFKNKIEKEGLPSDGPAGLGAGGPEFNSRRPDQFAFFCFLSLGDACFVVVAPLNFSQPGGLDSRVV